MMNSRPADAPFGTISATQGALSPQERDALLREPIVAALGTIDDEGFPYVVNIWTEWDGESIWLLCRAKAAYVDHMRARPKVSILVARGDAAQTRVLVLGLAELVAGPAPLTADDRLREVATRMAVHYRGDAGARYIDESLAWPRTLFRIRPIRFRGWGHIDWHPRYRG
ncbi:MAG TPA: pyridoxamine 5'-phosphate oxidase family protein [Candidatus Limnocylindrales bacterium]|nr:pyridoxamine 5'-phosphate oxidase family protein [Candidatus Limnocylindrales bacterium]